MSERLWASKVHGFFVAFFGFDKGRSATLDLLACSRTGNRYDADR
jgi:hypothetical protein